MEVVKQIFAGAATVAFLAALGFAMWLAWQDAARLRVGAGNFESAMGLLMLPLCFAVALLVLWLAGHWWANPPSPEGE